MTTNSERETLRNELRSWGKQQQRLSVRRDPLVRYCLAAGISKEEIHQSMGIALTTIDRIGKSNGKDEES